MAIKRPKPEEVVVKLRQVEVLMGCGSKENLRIFLRDFQPISPR